MKTIVTLGVDNEISKELSMQGNLVNACDMYGNITEYVSHRGIPVEAKRDTIESGASSVIIDMQFFKGIVEKTEQIEKIISRLSQSDAFKELMAKYLDIKGEIARLEVAKQKRKDEIADEIYKNEGLESRIKELTSLAHTLYTRESSRREFIRETITGMEDELIVKEGQRDELLGGLQLVRNANILRDDCRRLRLELDTEVDESKKRAISAIITKKEGQREKYLSQIRALEGRLHVENVGDMEKLKEEKDKEIQELERRVETLKKSKKARAEILNNTMQETKQEIEKLEKELKRFQEHKREHGEEYSKRKDRLNLEISAIDRKINEEKQQLSNLKSRDIIKELLPGMELEPTLLDIIANSVEELIGAVNLSEDALGKEMPNIIRIITSKLDGRTLLGEKNYELLVSYKYDLEKDAVERVKDTVRSETGDKRDIKEGDKRWKPKVLVITNDKMPENSPAKVTAKHQLDFEIIKSFMSKIGLEVGVPNIINTRYEDITSEDSRFAKIEDDLLVGIDSIRNLIFNVIEAEIVSKEIENGDKEVIEEIKKSIEKHGIISQLQSNASPQLIEAFNNMRKNNSWQLDNFVRSIMQDIGLEKILGKEEYDKIIQILRKAEKNADKKDKKIKVLTLKDKRDEDGNPIIEPEEKNYYTRSIFQKDVIARMLKEQKIECCWISTMGVADVEKVTVGLDFLDVVEVLDEEVDVDMHKLTGKLLSMFDALDVDGTVQKHQIRTAILTKALINEVEKSDVSEDLKLSVEEKMATIIAAFLHDNGKLLNLTGKEAPSFLYHVAVNNGRMEGVTDEAKAQHPETGAKNLQKIIDRGDFTEREKRILRMAIDGILYHQEFIHSNSEQGYSIDSKHTQVNQMPKVALYMGVVDTPAAMFEHRKYQPVNSLEKVMAVMASGAQITMQQKVLVNGEPEWKNFDPWNWNFNEMNNNGNEGLEPQIRFMTYEERQSGQEMPIGKNGMLRGILDRITRKTNSQTAEVEYAREEELHYHPTLTKIFLEMLTREVCKGEDSKLLKCSTSDKDGKVYVDEVFGMDVSAHAHRMVRGQQAKFKIRKVGKDFNRFVANTNQRLNNAVMER